MMFRRNYLWKTRHRACAVIVILTCAIASAPLAFAQEIQSPDQNLTALGEEFFRIAFTLDPSWATAVGIHEFDTALCSYSPEELQQYRSDMQQLRLKLLNVKNGAAKLSAEQTIEFGLLLSNIDAGLLEVDQVQHWRKDPDFYPSYAARSIATLINRDFAPKVSRLKLVIQREEKIPALIANGCANLESTPGICVDVALKQLPGIISFFESEVPKAFEGVKDANL